MKPATPPEPIEDPILSVVKPGPQPADDDAGRTTLAGAKRRGFVGVLHVLGPGLITGASDDDPSGIGTYSQVGSQFGYGLLWLALFTFPLMSAVQELCARIALQTGVGLGATLQRKFPRWLVGIAILGLLAANTFNVGADLGAVAAGGALLSHGTLQALWLVVPVALLIIVMQVFASYATIFKIFKWLTLALFAYVITAFFAHPPLLEVVRATFIPHVELSRDFVMALVAVLGTTISPYLFFWQASSEVDELAAAGATDPQRGRPGLKHAELRAARADVLIGMAFSNLVMYFIILTSAAVPGPPCRAICLHRLLSGADRRRTLGHSDPDRLRHLRDQGVPRVTGEPGQQAAAATDLLRHLDHGHRRGGRDELRAPRPDPGPLHFGRHQRRRRASPAAADRAPGGRRRRHEALCQWPAQPGADRDDHRLHGGRRHRHVPHGGRRPLTGPPPALHWMGRDPEFLSWLSCEHD